MTQKNLPLIYIMTNFVRRTGAVRCTTVCSGFEGKRRQWVGSLAAEWVVQFNTQLIVMAPIQLHKWSQPSELDR